MTPRKIHFFWDGRPLNYLRYQAFASFRKHNPDWEINYWQHSPAVAETWETGERLDAIAHQDYAGRLPALNVQFHQVTELFTPPEGMASVHISDLFGYKVLADIGGFVADTDYLFIRPLGPLLESINVAAAVTDTGLGQIALTRFGTGDDAGYIPVSVMAGHSPIFFNSAFDIGLENWNPGIYESCGTPALKVAIAHAPLHSIHWLPVSYFFTFQDQMSFDRMIFALWERDRRMLIHPDAVGIHWYGNHANTKRVIEAVTQENIADFRSGTICRIINDGVI